MYSIRMGQESDRKGIALTIVEGFYESFRGFGKPKQEIAEALSSAVNPQRFMVAVDDETNSVVGVIGIADKEGYPMEVKIDDLRKCFGFIIGSIIAGFMADEFYHHKSFCEGQAYLGFVAVMESHRAKGIAKQLLNGALKLEKYLSYTLDVVQGNEKVLPLYEGVGFQIVRREKEKCGWLKGFSFRYVLELK